MVEVVGDSDEGDPEKLLPHEGGATRAEELGMINSSEGFAKCVRQAQC